MNGYRIDPTPPPRSLTLTLVRLKAGEEAFFRVLSAAIFGYWSHWTGKCSVLCKRNSEDCDGCRNAKPVKWKGLLHVINMGNGRQCLVEVTNSAALQIQDSLPSNDSLRGKRLRLVRSRGGDNGRLRAEIIFDARSVVDLPPEIDAWPTVEKIFDLAKPFDETI
jgi:hypothetical protein